MTQSTRRPGFRLPWSGEGDEAPTATNEPNGNASAVSPAPSAPADEPAPGETVVGSFDPGTPPEPPSPEPEAPEPAPSADPVAAELAPSAEPVAAEETNDFLRSLVGAMRGVAEEERTASVADLRRGVDERVTQLEAAAAERAEELRRKTELDVTEIGEWAKSEIERINAEASHKVEARRQQLDQQLADHEKRSTDEVSSVRDRVAAYERELDAFFAQLADIDDPATFVAAARRMPKAPSLEGTSATPASTAGATPTASLDARLRQLGINRGGTAGKAAAPADAPAAAAAQPATGPVASDTETATESDAAPDAATGEATPTPTDDIPEAGPRDAQLAQRLAELDARPAPSTATTPAPGGDETDEVATAIMVKGLGSFGAITSFKQRLERLATVRSVTLSLGPTGEFVYRATHPREVDLGAAIGTLEPGSTVDRQPDGSLRITVQAR